MKRRVIQIGYKIDSPIAEAVSINAKRYRQIAEDMGWQVEVVAYEGSAFTPFVLWKFLRRLANECAGETLPIVHDFFAMSGFSLIPAFLRCGKRHISRAQANSILHKAGITPVKFYGRITFTQTLLNIRPGFLASAINAVDQAFSSVVPIFGTRICFLAQKLTA